MPNEPLPLRDIHLPLPVGYLPLAPGWWYLLASFLIGIAVLIAVIRRYRKPTALKQALLEVEQLLENDELSHAQKSQALSLILKKLAVTVTFREDVAGLSGDAWISWLRLKTKEGVLSSELMGFLVSGPYRETKNPILDQHEFRNEIMDLMHAIGNKKGAFLSRASDRLRHLI